MSVDGTLQYVILVGAAAGALLAVWKLIGQIARAIRGGMRLAGRVEQTLAIVEKELTPNGGSSMKDHVTATKKRFDALEDRVLGLEAFDGSGRRATDHPHGHIPPVIEGHSVADGGHSTV